MADIFLSYAREDAGWVEKLIRALEANGYSVWWDRNLTTGTRYLKETEAQLREARATIVVWSKVSVDSHWVADEAALARDLGRLAPISKDGSMPPLGFGQYQATDFSQWHGGAGEPLPALLKALAERTQHIESIVNPTRPAAKMDRRILVATGVVVALMAAALGAWGAGLFGRSQASGQGSVAVLAFTDHSQAGDQAHLANGMTAELLSRLRGIKNLTVSGGDWMPDLMKQLGGDPKVLGERLSVANILDGDVRSDGDSLRITARLTSATDGHLVWTSAYNRESAGIFAIQDEIASEVANALSVTLDVGLQSTSYGGTKNFEAYDHYLRGRLLRNLGSPDQPVRELEQAVAIDPNYARAWSELTIAYGQLARLARTPLEIEPALQKMDEASKRAEALAPNMWFGHTPRGWFFLATNKWIEADDAHRRALALGDVADPDLYLTVSNFDGQIGRYTHSRAMGARTKSIDPQFRERYLNAIWVALALRDYKTGWEAYDASVAEKPGPDLLRESYALWLALADGKKDRARASLKILAVGNALFNDIAQVLDSREGMAALARRLAGAPKQGRAAYSLAALLAGQAGEPELAVDLLRKAYLGPGWAGYFYMWFPQLAETRKTEGFKTLVHDLGFVAMWRKSGDWGDFCKPLNDTDFECT